MDPSISPVQLEHNDYWNAEELTLMGGTYPVHPHVENAFSILRGRETPTIAEGPRESVIFSAKEQQNFMWRSRPADIFNSLEKDKLSKSIRYQEDILRRIRT